MKRVVIANFYPVWPPVGGGQRRIFYLARELANEFDVEIVVPERSGKTHTIEISRTFRECRVAVEDRFRNCERRVDQEVQMAADLAYTRYWEECRQYQEVLASRLAKANVAITAHPYSIAAIHAALGALEIPVIFDSQNVEGRGKLAILKDFPGYLEAIRGIERMALERSDLTLACSEADAQAFHEDYGIDPAAVIIIENGVDAVGVPHVPAEVLAQVRARLGLDGRLSAVFGGSYHYPNFRAAERILELAPLMPDMVFVILGSVCNYPMLEDVSADNIRCLGQVDESVKWMALRTADIGLNPMELGSGTNIKMFEYAGAGLPALSTAFGARGIPLDAGTEYLAGEIEAMREILGGLSIGDRGRLTEMGQRARSKVIEVADWTAIGRRYRDAVRGLCS